VIDFEQLSASEYVLFYFNNKLPSKEYLLFPLCAGIFSIHNVTRNHREPCSADEISCKACVVVALGANPVNLDAMIAVYKATELRFATNILHRAVQQRTPSCNFSHCPTLEHSDNPESFSEFRIRSAFAFLQLMLPQPDADISTHHYHCPGYWRWPSWQRREYHHCIHITEYSRTLCSPSTAMYT